MFNMFRRWFSGSIQKNKPKIAAVAAVLFIVLLIAYTAHVMFSKSDNTQYTVEQGQTVYKPQETIISGKNIKDEQYKEDSNEVDLFINYCNDGNINEAYNMLSGECKENLYPTVEDFKEKYCDRYFSEKKEYNLQSWINNDNGTTYEIRLTNDILSTGKYESGEIYQDYITIKDNEGRKKINTNGFVCRKEINKSDDYDGINIYVKKVDIYMDYEEYTLQVTNNTENAIMLDNMIYSRDNLRIVFADENTATVVPNSISFNKLTLNSDRSKEIKIQFYKEYTNNSESKYMVFSKVVKNYYEYIQNMENYDDYAVITVNL